MRDYSCRPRQSRIRITVPNSKILLIISLPLIFGLAGFQCPTEPPELYEISPRMGSRCSEVRLTGLHFGEPQGRGKVLFNGFAARQVLSWTDTEILIRVPIGATTGPVTVETRVGTSNSVSFIVSRIATQGLPVVRTWRAGVCGPSDLDVEDFNEDGHSDVALTCFSSIAPPEIIVALGDGAGDFELVHIPTTTFSPGKMTVADFNNDSHLDIAYDSDDFNDFFGIILGDGLGDFGPEQSVSTGYAPRGIQSGDFDEDENMDLVLATGYYGIPGEVEIYFGNGQGGFSEPWYFEVGVQPRDVAVGDFNLDEHLDLAIANGGSSLGILDTVSVLLGDGTGNFISCGTHDVGDTPYYIITEDFNLDGNPDLAVTHDYVGPMAILLGDGSGNFSEAVFYGTGGGTGHLSTGDFNGDGILDVTLFADAGRVGIFFGDGEGDFPVMGEMRIGEIPKPITGDFNEDGLDDIFTGNYWSGTLSLALGDGSGGFGEASYFDASKETRSPQMADLNSDGWLDLVVANYTGAPGFSPISVRLNDGSGGLLEPTIYDTSGIMSDVKVAHMNEDEALDLLVLDWHWDRLYIFFGDGLGGFPEQTYIEDALGIFFAAGDWNGDGYTDTALANTRDDCLDIYLGSGMGTLTLSERITACNGPDDIINDDFNNDVRLDIAATCTSGGIDVVQIFLGDGQGSFVAGEVYVMPGDNSYLTSFDFNEDGQVDILLSSPKGLDYMIGLGDGTFLDPQHFPEALCSYHTPSAGDLDGDGHLDLTVPSTLDFVEIHWGLGGGKFEPPVRYNAVLDPTSSLVVDFNLDGKMDILATLAGYYGSESPYSGVALFYGDGQRGFFDSN